MSVLRFYGTKSDRHAYLRFKAGLVYHYGQRVRFLTLTGLRDDYRRAFKLLREWVFRNYGKMAYFAVRTTEGLGVLHIVFVGPFLPYDALSAYWQTLTGCWSVSVSEVRDFTRISWEMTRQHMRCRYSQSRDWLPKGLMSYWVYFKRVRPYDSWYEFVYMYPRYAPFVLETSRQVYLPV